jgi:ribonuclease Z
MVFEGGGLSIVEPSRLLSTFSGMMLIFLGTSSATPTPERNVQSMVLRLEGESWLFDCGEGTSRQLSRLGLIRTSKLTRIFITHLHGDHVFGLPGLLLTIAHSSQRTVRGPIFVYGPVGLARLVQTALQVSEACVSQQIVVEEISEEAPHTLLETPELLVQAARIEHTVPCWGFVVRERERPGEVRMSMLRAHGIEPGPHLRALKAGQPLITPAGHRLDPRDVLGPPRPGRKLVLLGDTCDPTNLLPIARDADLLVHEATLPDELQARSHRVGHSTPSMAARFALEAAARHLVLTHFSPRFELDEPPASPSSSPPSSSSSSSSSVDPVAQPPAESQAGDRYDTSHLVAAARRIYPRPVFAARDFLAVDLPMHPPDAPPGPLRIAQLL